MKRTFVLVLTAISLLSTNGAASESKEFSGAIGKGLQIRMRLELTGDSVVGTYFYLSRGETIRLSGYRQPRGYSLNEFDSAGVVTAHMEFDPVDDRNYAGIWQAKNKAPLSVRLSQLSPAIPIQRGRQDLLEFVHDTLAQESKRLHYEYNIQYPQIVNGNDTYERAQFNAFVAAYAHDRAQWVRKEFKGRDKEMNLPMDDDGMSSYYDVGDTVINPFAPLLSVLFVFEAYWRGAAHPQHFTEATNYSLQRGREISLADLFMPHSNYVARISRYCIANLMQQLKDRIRANAEDADKQNPEHRASESYLKEQLEGYREGVNTGAGPNADNFRTFTIDSTGITFYFDEYQVASYVDGGFQVTVPYGELRDVILQKSELWKWVRG